MIKVAIYKNSWSFESEEPDETLTLKEFEEKFNKNSDYFEYCKIKFIVI